MTGVTKGHHVDVGDVRLYVDERGDGYPLIVLHGGPGLDHHMFGDYLDQLAGRFRLIFVDLRAQGLSDPCPAERWTLRQMAKDVVALAEALDLRNYALLGHSYGAFVALQNAVDYPGHATQTIISSGIPSAAYLEAVARNFETFEPIALREQVSRAWEREKMAATSEEFASILHDQLPFHFGNPRDPRIADFEQRTRGGKNSPEVMRFFANAEGGGIDVEDRLATVPQPVLVLAGRRDRICTVQAAEAIAEGLPNAELVVFENSGHWAFVEENEKYLAAVESFLTRHDGRVQST